MTHELQAPRGTTTLFAALNVLDRHGPSSDLRVSVIPGHRFQVISGQRFQ